MRITMLAIGVLVAGCATSSKDLAPTYVSPLQYQSFSCPQLSEEAARVSGRASQLGGQLDQAAANDKAIAAGGILFFPAWFALGGTKQQEQEYSRLKGEYDAIQQAANAKSCSLARQSVDASSAKAE